MRTLPPWRMKMLRMIAVLVGLLIGLPLAWAGYFHQLPDHQEVLSWVKTPCRILSWGTVSSTNNAYAPPPSMSFSYEFEGKTYYSTEYDAVTDWTVDQRAFDKEGVLARQGPAFCYVNPATPRKATFHGARLWFPWSLIGGGLLLALVSLVFAWRTFYPSQRTRRMPAHLIEQRWMGRLRLGFCLVMLSIGLYQSYRNGLWDAIEGQLDRPRLIPLEARVESSGVMSARGSGKRSHMTYYYAGIRYSYEHDGRKWNSNRWAYDTTLLGGGSEPEAKDLLKNYPTGSAVTCWIHPDKPWQSTLIPGLRWGQLFQFMIPLAALFSGFWLLWTWFRVRRSLLQ